jgi:predicted transcriptional regulator
MGRPKLSDKKLLSLVDEGRSLAEIARTRGISRQAVSKRLIELRGKTTRVVAVKKVEQVVEKKLNALDQLYKINQDANEILDLLMRWNRGDKEALQVLESQVKRIRIGEGEELEIQQVKFKDPRELALRAMAEIRGQLSLQLEIYQTLFSVQAAEEFQKVVLEVIGEVDVKVRDEIVRRLNQRRSVRQAVHFV